MARLTFRDDEPLEQRAEALKERIYVTFTALTVVLVMTSHASDFSPGSAALTLLVAVIGTLTAVFAASFMAHLVVHSSLPDPVQLRRMLRVTLGAFGAISLPLIFVGVAALGIWSIEGALRASTIALLVSLAASGYLAVRRARMPLWQKLIVLLLEVALGSVVVALELLAHG